MEEESGRVSLSSDHVEDFKSTLGSSVQNHQEGRAEMLLAH